MNEVLKSVSIYIANSLITGIRLVHTPPEEFANGGVTSKMHEIFSVHTMPEEFDNATITGKRL